MFIFAKGALCPAEDKKAEVKSKERTEQKIEDKKVESGKEVKKETEKTEDKKEVKETPKIKKDHAEVYGRNLPISLKHSVSVAKFILGKKIDIAIIDLEQVVKMKKAIPFKGELAHRKGKGMMSGKYPVKASGEFIKLLKSLNSNCIQNGMEIERTVIGSIMPNKAPDRMHRGGRMKFKRTHVQITSKELKK